MSSRNWALWTNSRAGSPAQVGHNGQLDNHQYTAGALHTTEQYPSHVKPQFWMEGEVLPESVPQRERIPGLQQASPLHYWTQRPQRDILAPPDRIYQQSRTLETLSMDLSRASSHKPEFDDSDKQAVTGRETWRSEASLIECQTYRPRWYRQKRTWVLAAILVLVTIAVVLGTVFGLHLADRSSPPRNGVLLAQILSATTYYDEDDRTYMFATAKDGTIWYITDCGRCTGDWINLGGQFLSQPTVTIWNTTQRLDVFGVNSNHSVVYKTYEEDQWNYWHDLGAKAVSGISSCRPRYQTDRVDIFTLTGDASTREVIHDYWVPSNNNWLSNSTNADGHTWDSAPTQSPAKSTNSTPAVVCRNDTIMHDMVIYDGETSAVLHRQWSSAQSKWLDWNDRGGSFVGDPVVVSPSDDRVDFFGIGSDWAMYHFTWSNSSGYTDLQTLNGSWASVPSVVASADGRLDVFALDDERKLKHRTLIDTAWQDDWEDLGITAHSAPLAVLFDSASSIGVFALNISGNLVRGDYRITADAGIQEINKFYSIGGNLTDTWLAASNSSQTRPPGL